tara:strand:+ start:456 stop:563 length:108 start_codon:yes stop_codon:yes gene_type:complete
MTKYKKAFEIMMEYWDSIPEEEREETHKRLQALGL